MAPRSRLWLYKTMRIARIPPGNVDVPVPVVPGEPMLTESGEDLLTESELQLTTEAA